MPKQPTDFTNGQVIPNPNLEKRTRRVFPADYKLEIIQRAAQCKRGELGELLRQEGLYSAQLQQWRREYEEGGLEALSKSQPGPQQKKTNEQRQVERLKREIDRLKRELQVAQGCIELQKKVLNLHEDMKNGDSDSNGSSRKDQRVCP